jgi:hypothetical protein
MLNFCFTSSFNDAVVCKFIILLGYWWCFISKGSKRCWNTEICILEGIYNLSSNFDCFFFFEFVEGISFTDKSWVPKFILNFTFRPIVMQFLFNYYLYAFMMDHEKMLLLYLYKWFKSSQISVLPHLWKAYF